MGGQRRPWKVDYRYSVGIKGRVACRDEAEALSVVSQIRRNRFAGAGRVVLTLSNVDDPTFVPKVIVIEDTGK